MVDGDIRVVLEVVGDRAAAASPDSFGRGKAGSGSSTGGGSRSEGKVTTGGDRPVLPYEGRWVPIRVSELLARHALSLLLLPSSSVSSPSKGVVPLSWDFLIAEMSFLMPR